MVGQAAFGAWVQARRLALGLGQKEVAYRAGYSEDMIRKIESGLRAPSRARVGRLAAALDIPPECHAAFLAWSQGVASVNQRQQVRAMVPSLPLTPPVALAAGDDRPGAPAQRAQAPTTVEPTPGPLDGVPPAVARARAVSRARRWWAVPILVGLVALGVLVSARLSGGTRLARPTAGAAAPSDGLGPLGGVWVHPETLSFPITSTTYRLAVRAYPATPRDPAITYVNFTATWDGPNGGWRTLCHVPAPPPGSETYECLFDLDQAAVPEGAVTLSFDVYNAAGQVRQAPHGLRVGVVEREARP